MLAPIREERFEPLPIEAQDGCHAGDAGQQALHENTAGAWIEISMRSR
jgi:hypothetical protein